MKIQFPKKGLWSLWRRRRGRRQKKLSCEEELQRNVANPEGLRRDNDLQLPDVLFSILDKRKGNEEKEERGKGEGPITPDPCRRIEEEMQRGGRQWNYLLLLLLLGLCVLRVSVPMLHLQIVSSKTLFLLAIFLLSGTKRVLSSALLQSEQSRAHTFKTLICGVCSWKHGFQLISDRSGNRCLCLYFIDFIYFTRFPEKFIWCLQINISEG